jgi:hypothetical protein
VQRGQINTLVKKSYLIQVDRGEKKLEEAFNKMGSLKIDMLGKRQRVQFWIECQKIKSTCGQP